MKIYWVPFGFKIDDVTNPGHEEHDKLKSILSDRPILLISNQESRRYEPPRDSIHALRSIPREKILEGGFAIITTDTMLCGCIPDYCYKVDEGSWVARLSKLAGIEFEDIVTIPVSSYETISDAIGVILGICTEDSDDVIKLKMYLYKSRVMEK